MNTSRQALRLAAFAAARLGGFTPPLPMNLTISVTRACDSRCRTCGIWCHGRTVAPGDGELLPREYERLFSSIGPGHVYFLNISGGEPTLRGDLPEIVEAGRRLLAPAHVHLPTNGLEPDRIVSCVLDLLRVLEGGRTVLSVKPSLDAMGTLHDRIRGVRGNHARVMETLERLVEIRASHPGRLEVGCGTVLSRLNLGAGREVVEAAEDMGLDTVIHEIAENREEMGNEDWAITPTDGEYARAVKPFAAALARTIRRGDTLGALRAGLRLRMIPLTIEWLRTGRVPLACYAGATNAHVGPGGGLWACAVRARTHRMADLRDHEMDFRAAWSGAAARDVRRRIRIDGCTCPLANQMYANILLDPLELARTLATVSTLREGARA